MLSYSKYFINIKSCIFCRILVYNGSETGAQHLFLKRSLSFLLKKHSNIKTLTLVFSDSIHFSSRIIVVSLARTSLFFLTLFHYFFISSSVDGFNLIISLFFFWNSGSAVLLLSL